MHEGSVARPRRPSDVRGRLIDGLVKTTRMLARRTFLDFDHVYGVETQRAAAAVGTRHADPNGPAIYEATTLSHFRYVVAQLPRPLEQWSFVDVGSGKGRVVLLAMGCPFRRVVGVEYLSELHATAEANLCRYMGPRVAGEVVLFRGDVLDVTLPEGDLVVFFYNAVQGEMLEALLDRLERVVEVGGRRLVFIYSNPSERHRVDRRPAFRVLHDGASRLDPVWWGNRRTVSYALGASPD